MSKKQLQDYLKLLLHWKSAGKKGLESKIENAKEDLKAHKKKSEKKPPENKIEEADNYRPGFFNIFSGRCEPLVFVPESYDDE